jgi:hypothetical protein
LQTVVNKEVDQMTVPAPPNWQGKNIELVKEACRHGEAMLAAQVDLATSADQRAAVLAGIYAAVATGIIAGMATHGTFDHEHPLAIGAVVAIVAYLGGAALCIITALPASFWVPGNDPAEWYGDIEKGTPLEVAVGEQAAYFSKHIRENNDFLDRNAKLFFIGAVLGVAAPLLGFLAASVTCLSG